ncbi:MAG: transcription elongation factor GreA [Chloroflexi bacterium]|nr:transcription elongation factor GreA [Chloroflexota bacterium]
MLNSAQNYLTPEGAERLRLELAELTGPRRMVLSRRLRDAIKQGDLSENADYTAAKEDQAFLEGRIREVEHLLKTSTIIVEGEAATDMVSVGNRVTIQFPDEDPESYLIVGVSEARPSEGKISFASPIGQAVMGKRVGDLAAAETPNGTLNFKILSIA